MIKAILTALFIFLFIVPPCSNADNITIGGVLRILGGGSLVFPDGSVQYTATLQGPKGDKGDIGLTGPQGPPGTAGPSFSNLNYYALGDSITAGVGSTSGNYSYADILNAQLLFKSFTKLGVSGTTVMPYPGKPELVTQVDAIGNNADLITILIGVNDYIKCNQLGDIGYVLSKDYSTLDKSLSFSEAFRYCLETIKRSYEQARIYVILPLQTTHSLPPDDPLDQYRAAEIRIANYLSIPVIHADTESGLWIGGTLFPDGLHPNDIGQAMLANYLARKIPNL